MIIERSESVAQHVRRQAGAAHPQQYQVLRILAPGRLEDFFQVAKVFLLVLGNIEPVQPLRFIHTAPEPGIPGPEASYLAVLVPIIQCGIDVLVQVNRKTRFLAPQVRTSRFPGGLDGAKQFVEGIDKLPKSIFEQLAGDLLQRETGVRQYSEHIMFRFNVILETAARLAMRTECIHGRWWYRINGIGADQFVDIKGVRVGRVLGARAGP